MTWHDELRALEAESRRRQDAYDEWRQQNPDPPEPTVEESIQDIIDLIRGQCGEWARIGRSWRPIHLPDKEEEDWERECMVVNEAVHRLQDENPELKILVQRTWHEGNERYGEIVGRYGSHLVTVRWGERRQDCPI